MILQLCNPLNVHHFDFVHGFDVLMLKPFSRRGFAALLDVLHKLANAGQRFRQIHHAVDCAGIVLDVIEVFAVTATFVLSAAPIGASVVSGKFGLHIRNSISG